MLNVKNTIVKYVANMGSPHYCCSCGALGSVLCESCKYDIVSDPFEQCLVCLKPIRAGMTCSGHRVTYSRAYCVGWRRDSLEVLIGQSKFSSIRDGCVMQGILLASVLPQLDKTVVIVPVPTIRAHIRERGYDHMLLVARELSRQRDVPYCQLLERISEVTNTGATRTERHAHAANAFRVSGTIDPEATYLLIDDVYTTGATLTQAAKLLKQAGAGTVWIAATTRQPVEQ